MTIDSDRMEIEAVLEAVRRGHHDKDAAIIAGQFAPGAVIFDLAPPLAHGVEMRDIAAWLETWDGPVEQENRDLTIRVSGDLALCHGLQKTSARTKSGGEDAQWWQRLTVGLVRVDGAWKIAHEHASVPFHMDGSFRAAVDLEP